MNQNLSLNSTWPQAYLLTSLALTLPMTTLKEELVLPIFPSSTSICSSAWGAPSTLRKLLPILLPMTF